MLLQTVIFPTTYMVHPQILIFYLSNTDCDTVLLAKHHFLWAEVACFSSVQQLITFQDKNLHAHTMRTQKYFVHRVLQIHDIKV